MRALRGIIVLILALVLPAHVSAADFQAGWKAYQRGYYATAWEEWRPLAEQGNANAQYYLGVMHQNGEGVPQNYALAVLRYFQAAEQGLASAQKNLGIMYARGDGVAQNYVFSHMWLDLAVARRPPGVTRDEAVNFRDGIAKYMTPAEVAEAQCLAKQWKPKQPLF
jgi:hypothetical protein